MLLFVAGLIARLAAAAGVELLSQLSADRLALMFDGHVYLLIARSAPRLYEGIHLFFPAFRDSTYFTGWFPLYPALIALASPLGWTDAALWVSRLLGAGGAPLMFVLALRHCRRPALAAAWFCVAPGSWLLTGSLAFAEPAFVCAFLAALLALERAPAWPAAALCAAATLAQKSGVLILPIALAARGAQWRRAWPAAGALAGLILLFGWHGRVFGDPLIGARVQSDLFGGSAFAPPFSSLARGLLADDDVIGAHAAWRKLAVLLSLGFYGGVFLWGLRRRARVDRLCLGWLGFVLAFYSTIAFPWGYVSWGRFLAVAAPAAFILLADALTAAQARAATVLLPVVAALSLGWACVEGSDGARRVWRNWPPGYFESLGSRLR